MWCQVESLESAGPGGVAARVVQVQCGAMHTLALMQAGPRLIAAATGAIPLQPCQALCTGEHPASFMWQVRDSLRGTEIAKLVCEC